MLTLLVSMLYFKWLRKNKSVNFGISDYMPNKNITVPVVIEHLKRNIKDFQKYHVIKARGNNAAKYNRPTTYRLNFNTNNEAYLDLRPQIQLCFLSKAIIGDNNFKVIYPEQYAVGYII